MGTQVATEDSPFSFQIPANAFADTTPGDRLRYYPIDALQYDEIWGAAQRGEFDYDIRDETFDVAAYLAAGDGGR